ncbi:hypothetical protein K402DRAFT_399847 [Aulographum hederae CBS 113979]|uniref:Uncharacterized protein n=1 Tax=Aulographum hederae CBS 113979 TaxID=1176131 RepID=A0A6G1HF83_9PEZI|nr:hypothetical protein K402DRAFT_399847 [Aulographum hederae CBS 113979]
MKTFVFLPLFLSSVLAAGPLSTPAPTGCTCPAVLCPLELVAECNCRNRAEKECYDSLPKSCYMPSPTPRVCPTYSAINLHPEASPTPSVTTTTITSPHNSHPNIPPYLESPRPEPCTYNTCPTYQLCARNPLLRSFCTPSSTFPGCQGICLPAPKSYPAPSDSDLQKCTRGKPCPNWQVCDVGNPAATGQSAQGTENGNFASEMGVCLPDPQPLCCAELKDTNQKLCPLGWRCAFVEPSPKVGVPACVHGQCLVDVALFGK